jgi:hypothetical protein
MQISLQVHDTYLLPSYMNVVMFDQIKKAKKLLMSYDEYSRFDHTTLFG